ncbi:MULTISPECIES: uroporphyrinogen decarboxylase family protein [Desulfitobacterium]|uniref:Uroporphyrinogen-III decarboxylase n=1 Tax=Desulfitobacterium dehalogenans (strain ATCC 51507 / DSM 9161 / JW/IU-DC1) TaxID=756499 RepID=I4A8Z9_DESDJ|nr:MULTISPECIES: uroporphyrinogen decarboxylase family protein [Desulfitobacterium]AFM00434.1 uroporphyrinogen-III decarboxylase [Desulfitobacterium dehalogenans ATCC 51507]
MSNSQLYNERRERLAKAVALEKTDRTPVVLEFAAFAARVQNMTVANYSSNSLISAEAMIKTVEKVGGADGIDYGSWFKQGLGLIWLSRLKVPGEDLAENELWQVEEMELMKQDDYDRIVVEGWPNWHLSYIQERISSDMLPQIMADAQNAPKVMEMWKEAGVPQLTGGAATITTIPFEMFCGGRSFTKFVRDLFKIPDKVQAAMDAALPYMAPQSITNCKSLGSEYIWLGGWRAASDMLSQKQWDRFVFPYYEKLIYQVLDAGITPILHFDSNWTRDLARFKDFPKGKIILELDGMTDIFKAKEILGDTMCIMGDVPASLLSLGTPDDVHNYCRKLIEELGPTGFVLHSGCDIPIDAKLENVQAMVASVTSK